MRSDDFHQQEKRGRKDDGSLQDLAIAGARHKDKAPFCGSSKQEGASDVQETCAGRSGSGDRL
jgi:hypothetical protein